MAARTEAGPHPDLRVQLLGPIRAWSGDQEIDLGSPNRRAVLAILALHAGDAVSRAELVDGMWGDDPPARAVGNLHTYIHHLRRALAATRTGGGDSPILATVQSGYVLWLAPGQLDEQRFLRHREIAQHRWSHGDSSGALAELDAALSLWQGEALQGITVPFARAHRERLAELRLTDMERRASLLLARGDHAPARRELSELTAVAPRRETARGLLMVALNQAGSRHQALRLYRDTERMLIDEQGVEPGPVLRRIHRYVQDGMPVPADDVTAVVWSPRPDPAHRDEVVAAEEPATALAGSVGARTRETLLRAALLGATFAVGDLAVVLGVSPNDVAGSVEEAIAAGLLAERDGHLTFEDPDLRRTLVEDQPLAARTALHRDAAKALSRAGVPVERVAALLCSAAPFDAWIMRWLTDNIDVVAARAPGTAETLLAHALTDGADKDTAPASRAVRDALAVRRVRLTFQRGGDPADEARALLGSTSDAAHTAELRWILAQLDYRAGAVDQALDGLRTAMADHTTPADWRTRCAALRARFERTGPEQDVEKVEKVGDSAGVEGVDIAEHAETALRETAGTSDPGATAEARIELWYRSTVRRDHAAALAHADYALDEVGKAGGMSGTRLELMGCRAFSLQSLDRLSEASQSLAGMRFVGARLRPPAGLPFALSAAHDYWLGRWDAALAALAEPGADADGAAEAADGVRSPEARWHQPLLRHGVAALIAAHRGNADLLRWHLRAAQTYPLTTPGDQDSGDFVLMARAIEAGLSGGVAAELSIMDPLLDLRYGGTLLRHQWLPRLMRLAVNGQDRHRAAAALRACVIEADREAVPGRAQTALRWCRALDAGDAEELRALARQFAGLGRPVEMALAQLDAAIALAERRQADYARHAFHDALPVLTELGAVSDINRAETRLTELGVTELHQADGQPLITGWHLLSAVERQVATSMAEGMTNPEVATRHGLSRGSVREHLSQIMRKLGVESVDELHEAMLFATRTNRRGLHVVKGNRGI